MRSDLIYVKQTHNRKLKLSAWAQDIHQKEGTAHSAVHQDHGHHLPLLAFFLSYFHDLLEVSHKVHVIIEVFTLPQGCISWTPQNMRLGVHAEAVITPPELTGKLGI